ncbi:response regulator [Endozoicomonas gorgoniicola]|uniref:Response regulator n=1 Tax=Endozoicomonas gorgoniicola TaxID=1234144 RepID=A0ABT3MXV6_9GAMM|nr:response regulator [Endozoicomonas gorgoniicola]MCW7554210.1 response regulator [Endozoicomonas gorgoniicola]
MRIGIVEDSTTERLALKNKLKKLDYRVIFEAADGSEGLIKSRKLLPDVVLMDVLMPEMNGYQCVRNMRQEKSLKDIPVIYITSKNSPVDREWGLRQGASGYLAKPVNDKELKVELEKVAGKLEQA